MPAAPVYICTSENQSTESRTYDENAELQEYLRNPNNLLKIGMEVQVTVKYKCIFVHPLLEEFKDLDTTSKYSANTKYFTPASLLKTPLYADPTLLMYPISQHKFTYD